MLPQLRESGSHAVNPQQVSPTPAAAAEPIEEVASPVAGPSAGKSPAAVNPTQESDRIEDSDKEGAQAPPHPIARVTLAHADLDADICGYFLSCT